jgi:hypothetical protein
LWRAHIGLEIFAIYLAYENTDISELKRRFSKYLFLTENSERFLIMMRGGN